VNLNNSMQS